MNQITNGPNPTPDFGYDFDYAVWTSGTRIDLVNVPFNNDYRDVVKFTNRTALKNYIDGLTSSGLTLDRMTYVRPNTPIRIDIPFNRAVRYNYLRASNPAQPVSNSDVQRDFYYFILDAKYIAPNTTELILQLDVWQSYVYDVSFGRAYVERGHIGIANENQFNNFGRDYLTVPEGFDLGSEYIQSWAKAIQPIVSATTEAANVLVFSTVDLFESGGTIQEPKLVAAKGSTFMGMASGADVTIFKTKQAFQTFLNNIKSQPWISQGIISATMIPPITRYIPRISSQWVRMGYDTNPDYDSYYQGDFEFESSAYPGHHVADNWRNNSDLTLMWEPRHKMLKKFFTYPYMIIEMTLYDGNAIMLKPELWRSNDANVVEIPQLNPPNQRIIFYPKNYNSSTLNSGVIESGSGTDLNLDDDGDFLDTTVMISAFPTMAVVNNMAISYLASNTNQLSWQNTSADWSQQRALRGAQASYDVSTGAIEATHQQGLTNIAQNIDSTIATNKNMLNQALVNSLGGTLQGAAGSAVFGPGAMAAGAISSGIQGIAGQIGAQLQVGTNNELSDIQTTAIQKSSRISQNQQSLVRDTNYDLAKWSARGDYANTIAGINAKIQDAMMIQPSMSGQMGGESLLFTSAIGVALRLRFKTIDHSTRAVIGDFWLRYGYAINRWIEIPQSLKVMTKFTYWKCSEMYVRATTVPESHRQVIRGVMEKGVTIWSDPDDIGVLSLDENEPLEGISY